MMIIYRRMKKEFFKNLLGLGNKKLMLLNSLHILNDGFESVYLLLLPFIVHDIPISLIQVGILGAVLNVSNILLALPSGYFALKFGGIKTILCALVIYSVGFAGIRFTSNYSQILALYILGSVGFGLFHPIAFALIAKWSTKESRGRSIGNFTAIGDLGRIGLSTLLTFLVLEIGWKHTTFLYGFVAFAIAIGVYVHHTKNREVFEKKVENAAQISFWHVLKQRTFLFATMTNFVDNFASQMLFIFLPFLLLKRGFGLESLSFMTGAFFIGNFVGKTLLSRLVGKYSTTKVFIGAEILMALCIFLLANSQLLWLIILCTLVLGIFTKGTVPVVKTMVSEATEHHGNYEKAYGLNSIFSNTANTISPLVLGFVSQRYGVISAFNLMGLVALMAIIPAIGFARSKNNQ